MKLKVTSKADKFRRAGFAFTKEPQEIEVDQKTANILKGESMLIVEDITTSSPPKTGGEQLVPLNVEKTVALVMAVETIEALDNIARGETRKGVLEAIEKRRKELENE